MRPDVPDDLELEQRCRDSVAGRRPNAPASLREFIRQVPTAQALSTTPVPLRLARAGERPRTRRGVTGIAAAAAIVLAIAGGAALFAVLDRRAESSPSAGASASYDFETGGWGWRRVGEPAPGAVAGIANGYLGECISNGLPAACTSKDGVSWALPADPAVLAVDGAAPFAGWSVAHGAAGWVATDTIDPGTWRSGDGVHWSAVAVDLPGLQKAQVQALTDGFAMVAQVYDGQQTAYPGQQTTTKVFFSTDGAVWKPLDLAAGVTQPQPGGAIGLVATKGETVNGSQVSRVVSSSDGVSWTALTLPDGVMGLSSSIHLASGKYVAVGTKTWTYGAKTLLTSADGVIWQAGTAPSTWLDSLAVVGPHILAISVVPNTALPALWESTDGTTWQRIALLDGNPLSGTQLVALGDRVGLFTGSKLTMVGFPLPAGYPTSPPRPTSSPSTAASPTASPAAALVVGGWRWHAVSLVPDTSTAVVRVPNGYFGRCGTSMCTSPDGWSWHVPADPAIFATDGAALFSPLSVAHRPDGGYVVNAGEGVWYSLDGVLWKPATVPADPAGYRAVMYGASGFTLIGSPDDAIGGKSRLYSSPDGVTWTALGIGPMVGLLAQGDTSGGILDQTGKNSTGGAFGYSADGRTWVTATFPKNEYASTLPYRLADGSLVAQGGGGILRSTDGRSWVLLKTGWVASSIAVAGDRIVAVVNDTGNVGTAWESSDNGATFHQLMAGANQVSQFGDLVLLGAGGAAYVGAPLSPSESPGTTPTATGLPGATPAPTPTTAPTPAGGISKDEAIRIATATIHPTPDELAKVSASAYLDSQYGRWIWGVSFLDYYGGPLNAQGTFVDIDFFTGEVLASGNWIS